MNVHNKRIIEIARKEKVITTSDLARCLKVSWNTAEKYLLELLIDGKLERIKKEGVNLWMIK